MSGPKVTIELARQHGLSAEEYARVLEILGRPPSYTELGVFSIERAAASEVSEARRARGSISARCTP